MKKPTNREQRRRALQAAGQLKHGRIFGKSIDRIFSDDIPNAAKELASQTVVVVNAFENVRVSIERQVTKPMSYFVTKAKTP